MTEPNSERGSFSGRRRPPRSPLLSVLLLLLLGAILAGLFIRFRPRLSFSNRLAAPVVLVTADGAPRTVPPGQSVRVRAPWRKTMLATWELVRPQSADGKPMGEEIRGSLLVRESWGTISRTAAARGPAGNYFAPLITNASRDLLRVTVNAGLEGAVDCACAVRPGAQRAFIGYYQLYQNSTVQARAPGRRTAVFRDLGGQVADTSGTIGLRFEDKDLRAP